jgi:hypothetical protein
MTLLIIMNGDSGIVPHVVHLPYNLLPSNVSLSLSFLVGCSLYFVTTPIFQRSIGC